MRDTRCMADRPAPPDGSTDALTIGEVATRSGVATSALRFYEEQGLIHSERTDSGHRRYPRAVIRRVAFIVFAQRIGLSLEEIRAELAKLPRNRVPERRDWAKLSGSWTARIEERMAELERLEGRPHRVHRLRLPVARSVPAGQPGRSRRARRPRRPLSADWTDRDELARWPTILETPFPDAQDYQPRQAMAAVDGALRE